MTPIATKNARQSIMPYPYYHFGKLVLEHAKMRIVSLSGRAKCAVTPIEWTTYQVPLQRLTAPAFTRDRIEAAQVQTLNAGVALYEATCVDRNHLHTRLILKIHGTHLFTTNERIM